MNSDTFFCRCYLWQFVPFFFSLHSFKALERSLQRDRTTSLLQILFFFYLLCCYCCASLFGSLQWRRPQRKKKIATVRVWNIWTANNFLNQSLMGLTWMDQRFINLYRSKLYGLPFLLLYFVIIVLPIDLRNLH